MDDIDRELSERYDYNRRHYQSDQRITIPVALLEEAMSASMPGGDAHSLLGRALECGPRTTTAEVLGTATIELHADTSKLYAKLDEAQAKVAAHVKTLQGMLDSLDPGSAENPVVVHFEGQTREVPQAQGEAMADTFKRAFPGVPDTSDADAAIARFRASAEVTSRKIDELQAASALLRDGVAPDATEPQTLTELEARVVQLEAESAALQTGVKRYLRTLTFGD